MMIQNNDTILSNWFQDIFPDQVKVYEIGSLDRFEPGTRPTLLHKHFKEPPSKGTWEQLAHEIASFLTAQSTQTVYSFFLPERKHRMFQYRLDIMFCQVK